MHPLQAGFADQPAGDTSLVCHDEYEGARSVESQNRGRGAVQQLELVRVKDVFPLRSRTVENAVSVKKHRRGAQRLTSEWGIEQGDVGAPGGKAKRDLPHVR